MRLWYSQLIILSISFKLCIHKIFTRDSIRNFRDLFCKKSFLLFCFFPNWLKLHGWFLPSKTTRSENYLCQNKKITQRKRWEWRSAKPLWSKHGRDGLVSIVLLTRQVLRLIDRWGCPMALPRVLVLLQVVGSAQQTCTTSWGCPADGSDGVTVIQWQESQQLPTPGEGVSPIHRSYLSALPHDNAKVHIGRGTQGSVEGSPPLSCVWKTLWPGWPSHSPPPLSTCSF